MEQATIQIIALIAAVSALLGWVVRTVLNHFMARSIEKDTHIIMLVNQNQENVAAFAESVNHNQSKMNKSIDRLSAAVKEQTKVLKEITKK